MNKILLLSFCSLFCFSAVAQEKAPLLKGKVNISIKEGTFDCDLLLTEMPNIQDYLLFINAGMNIRYLRNFDDDYSFGYERSYDSDKSYECFGYYMNNNNGKFLPRQGLRFSYSGKFPVIADTTRMAGDDWKGNIAFNGYSVRTDGAQAGWYPILYDIKKDKRYDEVRYDLEVECSDCGSIYLNGNKPMKASTVHLTSDRPVEIMLYAGNYKTYNVGETYFINPDFTESDIAAFGDLVNSFKKLYEDNLHIPYGKAITYVNTTPISKENSWLWVSYPTIVNVSHDGIKEVFEEKASQTFMAHELGHYYFGTVKHFNSELGDMLSESFAEYLSMQASRQIIKDSTYEKTIAKKIDLLKNFKPTAISDVKTTADYKNRELYVYNYAPLIYSAIEKEIGIANMWKWMQTLLQTSSEFTNYKFIEQALATSLNDTQKLKVIKERYLSSPKSLSNAITKMQEK